jgi:phenylalanyl-tRNA synthetase beta chain
MRISCHWLKEYLPVEIPVEELATTLTGLGLEVSAVEQVESIRGGLHGVVAGKVIECAKHPNADRLSLTKVDIGTGDPLQIVCGAPNVRKDQHVWVARVGSTLYPAGADKPLVISKAKVRGEFSEGMICAEDELGLGEDHSGIMVLPEDVKPGTLASDYYGVISDTAIEIELTPNRSDAICHLGVARDLAAWFAINRNPAPLHLPAIPADIKKTSDYPIAVEVRNFEACPR